MVVVGESLMTVKRFALPVLFDSFKSSLWLGKQCQIDDAITRTSLVPSWICVQSCKFYYRAINEKEPRNGKLKHFWIVCCCQSYGIVVNYNSRVIAAADFWSVSSSIHSISGFLVAATFGRAFVWLDTVILTSAVTFALDVCFLGNTWTFLDSCRLHQLLCRIML